MAGSLFAEFPSSNNSKGSSQRSSSGMTTHRFAVVSFCHFSSGINTLRKSSSAVCSGACVEASPSRIDFKMSCNLARQLDCWSTVHELQWPFTFKHAVIAFSLDTNKRIASSGWSTERKDCCSQVGGKDTGKNIGLMACPQSKDSWTTLNFFAASHFLDSSSVHRRVSSLLGVVKLEVKLCACAAF